MITGKVFPSVFDGDRNAYRWKQESLFSTWSVWYYTGPPFDYEAVQSRWYIYYCDEFDVLSQFVDLPTNWILTS